MIDEKQLKELQGEKILIHTMDAAEIYDTLEALWKVARAARIVIKDGYWRVDGRHGLRESLAALEDE